MCLHLLLVAFSHTNYCIENNTKMAGNHIDYLSPKILHIQFVMGQTLLSSKGKNVYPPHPNQIIYD